MERLTLTTFGSRPISIAEIQAIEAVQDDAARAVGPCDKWAVMRDLNIAREAFGVSDRDLSVLSALLSFHPMTELSMEAQLVVFPSNRKLAERAHGMAESTLRRHIAALVRAGLIHRHDSPNGKRYVRRGAHGEIAIAFGFDLSPLVLLAEEIACRADEMRKAAMRLQLLRERVSLRLRDATRLLEALLEAGAAEETDAEEVAAARRAVRRKSSEAELSSVEASLAACLDRFRGLLLANETQKSVGSDSRNERHQHNSKPDPKDIEPNLEKVEGDGRSPAIPLALVTKACPEISLYVADDIRTWRDLFVAASFVRGMLGVSEDAWIDACDVMGQDVASIALACILQRYEAIHSPGGYLRALTKKAESGAFSPGPMVMALLSAKPEPASGS